MCYYLAAWALAYRHGGTGARQQFLINNNSVDIYINSIDIHNNDQTILTCLCAAHPLTCATHLNRKTPNA